MITESIARLVPETCARRSDQRQHSCDERDRGHQDRAQSIAVSDHHRVSAREPSTYQRSHVIDLQNGVFLHDAEEHEHSE